MRSYRSTFIFRRSWRKGLRLLAQAVSCVEELDELDFEFTAHITGELIAKAGDAVRRRLRTEWRAIIGRPA